MPPPPQGVRFTNVTAVWEPPCTAVREQQVYTPFPKLYKSWSKQEQNCAPFSARTAKLRVVEFQQQSLSSSTLKFSSVDLPFYKDPNSYYSHPRLGHPATRHHDDGSWVCRLMKFRCFPKGAEVPPTSTSARKTAARPAALDLRAAGTTRGGRSDHLKAGPVADIDCDDEVEEEIARAFAEGLKMDHPAAGSPPSSPVSDPATAAGGRDALAARTVIILDWDDTILTTTRLTSRYSVFGINGAFLAVLVSRLPHCVQVAAPRWHTGVAPAPALPSSDSATRLHSHQAPPDDAAA